MIQQYPKMTEEQWDLFWPKKAKVYTLKFKGDAYTHFIKIEERICFLELRDKAVLPMLRVLHQYPHMMDHMQCDKGAIRHIFSGSNVMAPGLTSAGGKVAPYLEIGHPVAITAEGKKHAMGIGFLQ